MTVPQKEKSEFGKGYAYCLGLFLAHQESVREWKDVEKVIPGSTCKASMWFYGAADHLYDLVIPKKLSEIRQKNIAEWVADCLAFRLCMNGEICTWEDVADAIHFAKAALLEWDEVNGIENAKGEWE